MTPEQIAYLERFGNVCTDYYSLPHFIPTIQNFELWIDSLDEPMKSGFKAKDFFGCWGVLSYRRFVLELNGIRMEEYLRFNLSNEDYEIYKSTK